MTLNHFLMASKLNVSNLRQLKDPSFILKIHRLFIQNLNMNPDQNPDQRPHTEAADGAFTGCL